MYRIRNAMGNQDILYTLSGMVEFDEGYYKIATAENIKLKRAKGKPKTEKYGCNIRSSVLRRPRNRKKSKG
jgi:hypothetical protein